MSFIKDKGLGILLCFLIALPSWLLGKQFPIVGGAVIAILLGMIITLFWNNKGKAQSGIQFTSKFILQSAVVLLGFGMNLSVILQTGKESLPIIIGTISTSLIVAWILHKIMHIPGNISTLIGVGSSICGGSAIAATAPVIDADDHEVAQAISVIFLFNALAALFFPIFGKIIGFSHISGHAFGIFAGTAINDTSSVTAAASTWDSMWKLGSQTLDQAVTVKLTRTLAIIPIVLGLSAIRSHDKKNFTLKKSLPVFIIYFIIASLITTIALHFGISSNIFAPFKELSKFFIIMAMAAIGLNSNVIKLIKTGGKPIVLGGICWMAITIVSLLLQHITYIW
ncbi:YeiH family protein [Kandleria sp.]|uniref:YeiH family protein n=1 Tax=Kandleria sp. TaxID=2774291 RepID=UPI001B4DD4A1|nr:YeiH family protein [Kandleria sp.]MBP3275825.1 YeiH family putative sulfate export transporter [Kandleria sp.]